MPPTKKTAQPRKEVKSGSDHEQEMSEEQPATDAPVDESVCTCDGDILVVGGSCTTCGRVVRL